MDALILFVAIVLAVSVIAGVMFSTTQSLLRKEQVAQKEKSKNLQKPFIVEAVRGFDSDNDGKLNRIIFVMRLKEASNPVKFNNTVILINSKSLRCSVLNYGSDANPNCTYSIWYGKKGPDWENYSLNVGDLVELTHAGSWVVGGVDDFGAKFTFVPYEGVATEIKVDIPVRTYPQNMMLWPLND